MNDLHKASEALRSYGADGLADQVDAALLQVAALREERDQWRQMVGRICSTIPVADVLASTGTLKDSVDYFKSLHKRLTAAEQRNAELVELLAEVQKAARKQAWLNGYPALFAEVDSALKPTESASSACVFCDGSGEYIDAIGDWRGYCSCPAGVSLKNKPTESGASE